MTADPIPWSDLSDTDQENFAAMLNRRLDVSLSVDEASEYYGAPEKIKAELGDPFGGEDDGPQCPNCFTDLYRHDLPHLKRTGRCPHCGEVLVS